MQPSLVLKQGGQGQVNMQGLVTVSSGPASMSNVMTLNKAQNVVTSQNINASGQQTLIPNVQILNMRPGAPGVSAAKSVATVSPRVVIGAPQVVGTRAAAPGITLQTLQGLQAGQQGHLLLKTENGQYQLLRVGPAPSAVGAAPTQAIRISTVPAHPGVQTVTTGVASASQIQSQQIPTCQAVNTVVPPPASVAAAQKPSDNTKEKCRNFLANLLELSSKEPKSVEKSVRGLIQELIDARVEPDEFCDRLERLLNASPQPCLIGFLKKSLPLLRQSMVNKELIIDGINPPSPQVAFGQVQSASNIQMSQMQKLISASKVGTSGHKSNSGVTILESVPIQQKIKVTKPGVPVTKISAPRGGTQNMTTLVTSGRSLIKEREKKAFGGFSQNLVDDKMGEDDINDVAAMGGVNLAEESQRILGSTEMIGAQIRSCKDETLVPSWVLQHRIKSAIATHSLHDYSPELPALLSHALHDTLRDMLQRLTLVARHRSDNTTDNRYEVTQDVKGQLKFLEELDRVEKKRTEDSEREILLRAAKSRSKNEDPEQLKLKAKAKEMQRAELEELRQREANLTALHAIGPRKKPRMDTPTPQDNVVQTSLGRTQTALRSRLQRVTLRDLLFLMEHDVDTARSTSLYKAYLRSRSD